MAINISRGVDGMGTERSGHRRVVTSLCALLLLILSGAFLARAERLPVKVFTAADGLGSSFVNHLMRDSRGFLWFATRDGLSRFDGTRFVTYQVGEDGPPGIENIFESKGIYWISTTGGLFRYDPSGPAVVQKPAGSERRVLNANFIADRRGSFFEDRVGTLFFFSGSELSVVEDENADVTFRPVDLGLPEDPTNRFQITALEQSLDGCLWIATTQGFIRRLPNGRTIFLKSENADPDVFNSILEDNSGRIWITRTSGVYVHKPVPLDAIENLPGLMDLDAAAQVQIGDSQLMPDKPGEIFKFTSINGLGETSTKLLSASADGHIWISGGERVVEFDGQSFRSYSPGLGFGGDGLTVEDLDGNLWLGGDKSLTRLDRSGFSTFDSSDGLGNPNIVAIDETNDGTIYAVSSEFFINELDGDSFRSRRPQLPEHARVMWHSNGALLDSRNQWWFLTSRSLYRFPNLSSAPLTSYDGDERLSTGQMYRAFEDSLGNVWLSTRASGDVVDSKFSLTRFEKETQTAQTFSPSENYPSRRSASAFAEDSKGNIWIGFYEGGTVRYSGGRFTDVSDGLPEGLVTALHFDKTGRLWIATALSGVGRIDDHSAEKLTVTTYTTANGLSSNNARSITEDNFGQIYIGTARGVDRISPDTSHIKHYSTSDGLAGDFVNVSYRDRNGNLWFGTPNGISSLIPERDLKKDAPRVWVSGLRIDGEHRPVSELGVGEIDGLELSPEQNNLQVDFFALDFSPGGSILYQYLLEGADKDWSPPSDQRTVNFSNLSPGSYQFLVRAVTADGTPSASPAKVSFKLLPPVWQRWWFVTVASILILGSVFGLDRFRVRKTRQVKDALQQTMESETRYRTLAATASDAIITIDESSNILYANEAVEKIFGYTAKEIIGTHLTALMPERFRTRHEGGLQRFITTGKKNIAWTSVELPGQHKNGAEVPLELSFGEFEVDGKRYFTGIARDISERKRSETALRHAREERLRELERVRKRIATDLHDDVGSSLTQIALFSEVARQRRNENNGGADEPLDFLVNISNELVETMSDIVWAINPNKDQLHDLTQRMRHFASEILTAAGIDLDFEVPDAHLNTRLGANLRREIFLIFKEAVNNVVKHSTCERVRIEFSIEQDMLKLSIADDGRGFERTADDAVYDWQKSRGGNGLTSMTRRATDLGGELNISSTLGAGTTVILTVPLEKNIAEGSESLTLLGGDGGRANE